MFDIYREVETFTRGSMIQAQVTAQKFSETLVCQAWTESDEGWPRPGGYTLHRSLDDCRAFREEFWREQRRELGESTPPWYIREAGDPFLIPVTKEVHAAVEKLLLRDIRGAWGEGDIAPRQGVTEVRIPPHAGPLPEDLSAQELLQRMSVLQDPLVIKAASCAATEFAGKERKMPPGAQASPEPYFSHLQKVAFILAEQGFDAEVVAAAYLHDHIEDLPERWSSARLTAEFGERVAALVDWVTQKDKSAPWRTRQQDYAARLTAAPHEAIALSAADKISNLGDMVSVLKLGYPVNAVLKHGWRDNSEKSHHLRAIFAKSLDENLLGQFDKVLAEFDSLGEALLPQEVVWSQKKLK